MSTDSRRLKRMVEKGVQEPILLCIVVQNLPGDSVNLSQSQLPASGPSLLGSGAQDEGIKEYDIGLDAPSHWDLVSNKQMMQEEQNMSLMLSKLQSFELVLEGSTMVDSGPVTPGQVSFLLGIIPIFG